MMRYGSLRLGSGVGEDYVDLVCHTRLLLRQIGHDCNGYIGRAWGGKIGDIA